MRSLLLAALVAAAAPAAEPPPLVRGDAAWARRADGQVDGRARQEPATTAVDAYQDAVAADPERLEPQWKLLRALWFTSEFTTDEVGAKRTLLEQARTAADGALATVAARAGGRRVLDATAPDALRATLPPGDVSDVAHVYFWSVITMGAWSRTVGLLTAVRAGVATRLHDDTLRAIALDPAVDDGGPLRLLSRLHAEVPHVPFLSGWVERSASLPLAERAYALDPAHPGNAYVLGLALLEAGDGRWAEGLRLVERTARSEPRPTRVVEDLAVRRDARERLERARAGERLSAAGPR